MLRARFEIELALPGQKVEHVLLGDYVFLLPRASEIEQVPLIAQPACMMNQLRQGDSPAAKGRNLGHVLAHVVLEREPSIPCEQQDGERGELLGDRRHVKYRRRQQRGTVL